MFRIFRMVWECSAKVTDLTGCSLENVLYEVSAQRAVIARPDADSSVVIVGYDQYNTYFLIRLQER